MMKNFGFYFVVLLSFFIIGCNSSEPEFNNNNIVSVVPVQQSTVSFASNGIPLSVRTRAVSSYGQTYPESRQLIDLESKSEDKDIINGWSYGQTYIDYRDMRPISTTRGEYTSQEEYLKVKEYLQEHPNEGSKQFDYSDYFVQFVGKNNYNIDNIKINSSHELLQTYNTNGGNRLLVVNSPIKDASFWVSVSGEELHNYLFYNIDGNYYLCFDYSQSRNNVVTADGIYDDYIIKLVPCITAELPDVVDDGVSKNGGSVEVNLSINEEHEKWDWVESHLSIHLRDTTDVTVFLPVEMNYYCAQDDLMIVQKHDEKYVYVADNTTAMDINGNGVIVNVQYKDNGIEITTKGINAAILKYLRDRYNDGLTVEVRNYYNNILSHDDLKNKLNNSTISFTHPAKTFVNAFGIWNGNEDKYAAIVKPDNSLYIIPNDKVHSEHENANLFIWQLK